MSSKHPEFRRYLVPIDTAATQQLFTDCLIIGAGIAGLRAAIEAGADRTVTLLCKGNLDQSNTWNAQGGIASVLDKTDSLESHISDTLEAGCGVCDEEVVNLVINQGPELIAQLLEWGTDFDMVKGKLDVTLEGGHTHPRVVHGHGDTTGRVISEALIKKNQTNAQYKHRRKILYHRPYYKW